LVKIRKKSVLLSECSVGALTKNGSIGFACVSACAVGAIANVPFAGRHKIELKKCAVGKIKNTEGSAMSVGLLVVRLKYGLYVGHLSKWFVCVSSFMFLVVCLLLHCRLLGLPIKLKGKLTPKSGNF
jgi:hypothetical protein